jgi:ATP-dependent Clp protease adapter protein ClpS
MLARVPIQAWTKPRKGIAGTYGFDVAEQKQSEVLLMAKVEEHPLRVEVERV